MQTWFGINEHCWQWWWRNKITCIGKVMLIRWASSFNGNILFKIKNEGMASMQSHVKLNVQCSQFMHHYIMFNRPTGNITTVLDDEFKIDLKRWGIGWFKQGLYKEIPNKLSIKTNRINKIDALVIYVHQSLCLWLHQWFLMDCESKKNDY